MNIMTLAWTPDDRDIASAEADIEWWHACAQASLGIRAADFEPSGITWDASQIDRLFENVYRKNRVDNVRRWAEVSAVVQSLGPSWREDAAAVYRDHPWPAHVRNAFPCDRKAAGVVCLAGAALRARATAEAFLKARRRLHASSAELRDWVDDTLRGHVGRDRLGRLVSVPRWAQAALGEAREMRRRVCEAYAVRKHLRLEAVYGL